MSAIRYGVLKAGKFDQSRGLRGKSVTFVHWEVRSTAGGRLYQHLHQYTCTRVPEYSYTVYKHQRTRVLEYYNLNQKHLDTKHSCAKVQVWYSSTRVLSTITY